MLKAGINMAGNWEPIGTVGRLVLTQNEIVKQALEEATSNRWTYSRMGDRIRCYVCGEMQLLKDVMVVRRVYSNGIVEYELQCTMPICPPPGKPSRGQGAELQFPCAQSDPMVGDGIFEPDQLGVLLENF